MCGEASSGASSGSASPGRDCMNVFDRFAIVKTLSILLGDLGILFKGVGRPLAVS